MSRIIVDLRNELNIIVNGVKKIRIEEDACFKTLEKEGKFLSYPKDIQWSYYRAILILREKAINIGKSLSDNEIKRILDDFLIDLLYNNTDERMKTVEREIKQLFATIKSIGTEKHLFIMPINYITISGSMQIGDSQFFTLDETSLIEVKNQYSLDFSTILSDTRKKTEDMNRTNETSTYTLVIVEANDDDKAEELAILKTERCLNVLRLFYIDSPFTIRDEKIDHFVRDIIHVNLTTQSCSGSVRAINLDTLIGAPHIDVDIIQRMEKDGLTTISQLLSKDEDDLTPLEKDILTAIFWFGSAMKERQRDMKFVKLMTAIETILIPDGGTTKQHRLAARFASIIYNSDTPEERKKVYHIMKNLYQLRSSILHSGKGYVYEEDMGQAVAWSQRLILQLLKDIREQLSLSKLLEKKYPIDEKLVCV
jgi:hypothetical protein